MSEEICALHEGAFDRAVVLELRDGLVAHAHAESQFASWLGGARAAAHLGSELVEYDERLALGTNAYESHDAQLMEPSRPAVFLCLYIKKECLDQRARESGLSFYFPSPRVPITPRVREARWRVLDVMVSPHSDAPHRIDDEVRRSSLSPSSRRSRPSTACSCVYARRISVTGCRTPLRSCVNSSRSRAA